MQVVHDALNSTDLPYGGIATIGNYDGIHRGQRRVIDQVVKRARAEGVQAIVISFDPHPKSILRPESVPRLLTVPSQREAILAEIGVDALLLVRFSQEFARTPAEDFARHFLHERLALQELYVGTDFAFGYKRQGNVEMLSRLGETLGFKAIGVEPVLADGEILSSTRIRRALGLGEIERVTDWLGRPYALRGTVVRGERMGMRLGWPTINLMPDNECLPSDGVYSTRVFFPNLPATFDSVTNIGTRPTVYEHCHRVVESHILGFNSEVYGETVEIRFHKRLREERMFSTVMDLSAQIGRDVEATREYFAARRRLQEG